MSELQFATEKRFRLCRHARRLEGHHLPGALLEPISAGNLAAESRVQATEPQTLFHIAQLSYRTDSEPRRLEQSHMSLRLYSYTTPCLYKSCLGAASARHGRRLDHQGPPGTPHRSGAALGRPGRPPGGHQGPAGPRESSVRGTACIVSRVKQAGNPAF